MKKESLEGLKNTINMAQCIIVTLKSGKKYLYNGTFQFKLHEESWGYCDSYNTNREYIDKMYTLSMIENIELLYPDCNMNTILY